MSGVTNQSKVGGPKWTKMDLIRPKWTILVHLGLMKAKIQFGLRSCCQNGQNDQFGPCWSSTPSGSSGFQYEIYSGGQIAGGHLKAFLSPGSLSWQRRHRGSSKVLAGWACSEMLSQYPQSAFRGSPGSPTPRRVSGSLRPKPSASICSNGNGGATTKGNDRFRPRKNPRAPFF